ncbi:MAG: ABC transporter substrate-binding protein [Pseudomonadota bacterium]
MMYKLTQKTLFIFLVLFSGFSQAMPFMSFFNSTPQARPARIQTYPPNYQTRQTRPAQPYLTQKTASPVAILEKSIHQVLDFLKQPESTNKKQLKQYVISVIAPNFDFDYMSRSVAGKRYYQMSKEQQELFKHKFTEIFITTFVKKMTKNRKSLPRASRFISSRQSPTEARASVLLSYAPNQQRNNQRVKVDFRFFKTAAGWKIVDVKANGLSALLYFRDYFNQLIKQRQS